MKKCKHKKVYSNIGMGNNAGNTNYWICEICGKEGTTFTPHEDKYSEVKRKFSESMGEGGG